MRRALIMLGLAALAALVPVSSAAAAARWMGFNDNAALARDLTPGQDAALLARSGANSARITVNWSYLELAPGTLGFDLYDPIYRAWTRRGIRPLLVVMGAPQWAWPRWTLCARKVYACHMPPDRTKDAAWANFVAELARQYPLAAGIEVWNEPNLRGFFASGVNPGRYTELLKIAHDAVERVAPSMPVLGGSVAPVIDDSPDGTQHGAYTFLRAMYEAGARGHMDGLAIHPYPFDRPGELPWLMINAALDARDAAGDDVPLWITEVGASTTGHYTERTQAELLGALVPRLMARPDVAAVYVHTLVDPRREGGRERGFGVMRDAGHPKPAFCAVARAFGSGRGCP